MLVCVRISRPFELVLTARMDAVVSSPMVAWEEHAASRCSSSKALAMAQGGFKQNIPPAASLLSLGIDCVCSSMSLLELAGMNNARGLFNFASTGVLVVGVAANVADIAIK